MIGFTPHKIDFATLCANSRKTALRFGPFGSQSQFPMTQREVVRAGKTVGVYFCLHGPRSVKLTAICDFTENTVIFYGSDGIRRESVQVAVQGPVAQSA